MFNVIERVLDASELTRVRELLAECEFLAGSASADASVHARKHNLEVSASEPRLSELNAIVMENLVRHARYRAAALPRHVAAPYYARYRAGDGYGTHIDNPIMGPAQPYRSDLAVTVFLNEPGEYSGGELVVQGDCGEQQFKLAAGNAVLYPASFLHRVETVTQGERLVAVSWVQSLVRDHAQRRLLFELGESRDSLRRAGAAPQEVQNLDRVYANLVRMWAQT